jgi:hypothetical protein
MIDARITIERYDEGIWIWRMTYDGAEYRGHAEASMADAARSAEHRLSREETHKHYGSRRRA